MKELSTSKNIIHLEGVVFSEPKYSHEILGEKFYNFTLCCKRLSGIEDKLQCLIPDIYIDHIRVGAHISTVAEIRTYNIKENDKTKLKIYVFISDKFSLIEDSEEISYKNNMSIEGYVCKKPIYRVTPLGKEVADVLLAVNRPYGKSDYIPIIVWGRNAKRISLVSVGTKVRVNGRLQSREYNKKIGENDYEKRVAYEMSAISIKVLEDM